MSFNERVFKPLTNEMEEELNRESEKSISKTNPEITEDEDFLGLDSILNGEIPDEEEMNKDALNYILECILKYTPEEASSKVIRIVPENAPGEVARKEHQESESGADISNDLKELREIMCSIFAELEIEQDRITYQNKIRVIRSESCQNKVRSQLGSDKYTRLTHNYGQWQALLTKIGLKPVFHKDIWWVTSPEYLRNIKQNVEKYLKMVTLFESLLIGCINISLSSNEKMSARILILQVFGGELSPNSNIHIKGMIRDSKSLLQENIQFREEYGDDSDKIIEMLTSYYNKRGDFLRFVRRYDCHTTQVIKKEGEKEIKDQIISKTKQKIPTQRGPNFSI